MTIYPPRPLRAAWVPILLSEIEQDQRPRGNGDRKAIVVGAGLCAGEGERAYTAYSSHYTFASRTNIFSCLEDVSATKTFRSKSSGFHSIPATPPQYFAVGIVEDVKEEKLYLDERQKLCCRQRNSGMRFLHHHMSTSGRHITATTN